MDNMLQMQILQADTRGLFVPTSIRKLTINMKKHIHDLFNLPDDKKELPVYIYKDVGLIKAGGVELRGIKASAIARKKPLSEPVIEKYQFVPYIADSEILNVNSIVRVCVNLALENCPGIRVKTVELLDSSSNPDGEVLTPIIFKVLGDLPLIQADCQLLAKTSNPKVADIDAGITIEDKRFGCDQSALLVVISDVLSPHRAELLNNALSTIQDGGFILVQGKINEDFDSLLDRLVICVDLSCQSERFILLKKLPDIKTKPAVVKVSEEDFSWIPVLQAALKAEDSPSDQRIILYAQNEPLNGLLGLINCLRRELNGGKIRAVLILDKNVKPFSIDNPTFKQQLDKDLVFNVFKNGQWGSYRHLELFQNMPNQVIKAYHGYVNQLTRGDLSSLTWIEGPIKPNTKFSGNDEDLVTMYYCALNFRDIMLATGKLSPEFVAKGRMEQECVLGFEYSGRDSTGKKVMGFVPFKAMCTVQKGDKYLMWDVPDNWSLEEAATVPGVYGTALYALTMSGRMQKGDSVLIHAGSGGVGQAAINLALHAGCTVFTTVGTPEKREFIRKTFPQILDSHIGNSRDTSFEQMVMQETNGRGVDLVLNSLAEEKLQASVRCLATGGRFLEIGKFDLANNNNLGMETFLNETSFHGVMLDGLFYASNETKRPFHQLLTEAIKSGAVKPLCRTVFPSNEVEQAFRYMAAGKHIGKVLLKIRPEEPQKFVLPEPLLVDAKPRFLCNSHGVYIIIGGLGGFGLELTDWLVLRGAQKVVLTSRSGVKTGYQAMRIRLWQSYGVTVKISTDEVTTEEGVQNLLQDSNKLGPVCGVFNLAVVLRDAAFENQTEADFVAVAGPKAFAAKYLDSLSRTLCPHLEHFVMFSSVSCGRGNGGQTNYGMANSVMERICEARHRDKLPATAIQWGAVGDVGLLADLQEDNIELVIGGTLQQKISNCLELMDTFLRGYDPIVSSMIVAEKHASGGIAGNIVDTVVNILGLRDLKTVSLHSTLAELGMDSMMAVEIKQTLEREFEVFLTPQDIRGMTFSKLQEIAKASEKTENKDVEEGDKSENGLPQEGLAHLLRVIGDEFLSGQPVVRLPSLVNNGSTFEEITTNETIFMIPGVEGVSSIMEPLAKNLGAQALCLQFDNENVFDTIHELAASLLPHVLKRLQARNTYNLVGYSFGGIIAMELALLLEKEGFCGCTILIDGAPDFLKKLTIESFKNDISDENVQIQLLLRFVALVFPQDTTELEKILKNMSDWKSRLDFLINNAPESSKYSKRYQKLVMNAAYSRVKSLLVYEGLKPNCINSSVNLIRPSEVVMSEEEDYGLSKYTVSPVPVTFVEGNHFTVLNNKRTADIINKLTGSEDIISFKQDIMASPAGGIASLHQQIKHM